MHAVTPQLAADTSSSGMRSTRTRSQLLKRRLTSLVAKVLNVGSISYRDRFTVVSGILSPSWTVNNFCQAARPLSGRRSRDRFWPTCDVHEGPETRRCRSNFVQSRGSPARRLRRIHAPTTRCSQATHVNRAGSGSLEARASFIWLIPYARRGTEPGCARPRAQARRVAASPR
jgi:hypothetical protein